MIELQTIQASLGDGRVKILVYGESGAGKTTLIGSMPDTVIISREGRLLSIAECDAPVIRVGSLEELREAVEWLEGSEEAAQFQSASLDSISEICEALLGERMMPAPGRKEPDGRQEYQKVMFEVGDIIRRLRDNVDKHVYCIAKVERDKDELGRIVYCPSATGNKLTQALPYFFDVVAALRVRDDKTRFLQCQPDGVWTAKDATDSLDPTEEPDLGALINKIKAKRLGK